MDMIGRDLWNGAVAVLLTHPVLAITITLAILITFYVIFRIIVAIRKPRTATGRSDTMIRRAIASVADQPKWIIIPGGFLCAWALVAAIVYCIEYRMTSPNTRAEVHYVYQILTGNWSSPPYMADYPKPFKYTYVPVMLRMAISTSFAIVLNFTALGALGWVLQRVNAIRKGNIMNQYQLNSVRDALLIASILEEFPQEQRADVAKRLETAFVNAEKKLDKKYLGLVFPSPDDRARIHRHMNEDVLSR